MTQGHLLRRRLRTDHDRRSQPPVEVSRSRSVPDRKSVVADPDGRTLAAAAHLRPAEQQPAENRFEPV